MTQIQKISAQEIEGVARYLTTARESNLGVELQLPVFYPTGRAATVVIVPKGKEYLVHDAASGAMVLSSSGVSLSKSIEERLSILVRRYGCDFSEGRVSRACSKPQIPLAAAMVANASRTIADEINEIKKRAPVIFKKEITEVVAEAYGRERIREQEAIKSDNGTTYRVDAVVLDAAQRTPISFVEAVTDEQALNRHFREFYDLKVTTQYEGVNRVGIFDDRKVWRPGDLAVLKEVAQVVPYARAREQLMAVRV